MKNLSFKIAIVGLGPKGLYGFERILAYFKANPIKQKVEIHLFNKTSFMGSGDVYRSDQPDYLLMNFANKHINMWPENPPLPIVDYPMSLSEFLTQDMQQSTIEIDPLYSSRATVGAYLENGFKQLCKNLPENIVLHQHISVVQSIEKIGDRYSIHFKEMGKPCVSNDFENILISTGHQRHKESEKTSINTVNFIYPVEEKLKNIKAGQTVAIKGMGLTFIDAVLALTEGRGGLFTIDKNGELTYKASGKEPKCIYPFSKSGWPMLPKYHFNLMEEKKLYTTALKNKEPKLNFCTDILQLIKQDMEFAYYSTLFHNEEECLEFNHDYALINIQIDHFHQKYPQYEHFSMSSILEPEFDPTKSTQQNVLGYLGNYTNEKNQRIVFQAELHAAAIWRKISPIFNEIYSFSGLEPDSQKEFDQYYFSKFNRIAYGPPPINLKKILAVAQAGFLDFRFAKSPKVELQENGYKISNEKSQIKCDNLIDARIPKNSINKESSGLYMNLCENGLARPYFNRDNNSSYATGTVEINRKGNLINSIGNPENITLYGTPTEGIVHDNDTLSRKRNNFATPWAKSIIQQLTNRKNDFKQEATGTLSHTK